jgi:hypothetical protein
MKKEAILPLLLILPLLTSGCSIPGLDAIFGGPQVVEYEHDVLVIKDLQAIPSEVAPGQQFRIISYIQNIGKDTIPQPELENLKGKQTTVELYDYCEGLFDIVRVNCPDGEHKEDGTSFCVIDKILPGQVVEVDWVLKSHDDIKLETRCPTDGMKVLVRYPYKTTSLTTITIMDENEMQRQIEDGTFQWKESYIVAGRGPIKPYLYVEDQQPISQSSGSTVLALQVENKGVGFLVYETSDEGGDTKYENLIPSDRTSIKLPEHLEPKKEETCNFQNIGGQEYKVKGEGVKLIYDKSPKLLCEVKIPDKSQQNIAKEATLHATVEIEYEYEFRDKVSVLVSPKM